MVDLMFLGGTIITMDGDRRRIENGALVVEDGFISELGPRAEVEGRYAAKHVVDCANCLVMPALVDCRVDVRPPHPCPATWEGGYSWGRLMAAKALLGGVGTLLALAGAAADGEIEGFLEGCAEVGVRAVLGCDPSRQGQYPAACISFEVEGGKLTAQQAGLLGEGALVQVQPDTTMPFAELKQIEQAGASLCFTASRGHCRNAVGECIEIGIPTVITPRPDQPGLLEAVHSCAFLEDLVHHDERFMQAGKLLELLTVDGARCLGLARETGALAKGMRADLALFRWDQARTAPCLLPEERVAYWGSGCDFTHVYVAGQAVMAGRRLENAALEEILSAVPLFKPA